LRSFFGDQALNSVNNEEWSHQRAILNRSVANPSVFLETIIDKVNVCLSIWEKEREVTIGHWVQKLTLDVLASCIFGIDFDTMNGKTSEVMDAYNYIISNFKPLRFIWRGYNDLPIPANKKLRQNIDFFDKYCWDLITEKKKSYEQNKENTNKNSLIELMIQNGLSDKAIRDNVSLFFIAGHETTSSSISWLLTVLVSKPEIQDKLRAEVLEKIPGNITPDAIKELTYMDCLIRESMRSHPPVVALRSRVPREDNMIVGNIKVPKGFNVQIDLISIAYDPKIWGDPENFRPERWFPENLTKEQRSAWIPFGYGPRICIGMNFSLLEQKVFLINLVKRFKQIRLSPKGEIKHKSGGFNIPDTNKLIIEFIK